MNIAIVGGGNQAQYVIDIVEKQGHKVMGIIDSVKEIGTWVYGYKVIGRQEDINELRIEFDFWGVVIAIGDNYNRYKVYTEIKNKFPNLAFLNAFHPSVIIGKNVTLGEGIVAMAGVIINPGAVLGCCTFFATGAQIEHDCVIGEFASISAGTVLGGYVRVGGFSALTLNVTVVDRVKIGKNTVIGAASLVLKDVPDNVLAFGNPIEIRRKRTTGEKFLK